MPTQITTTSNSNYADATSLAPSAAVLFGSEALGSKHFGVILSPETAQQVVDVMRDKGVEHLVGGRPQQQQHLLGHLGFCLATQSPVLMLAKQQQKASSSSSYASSSSSLEFVHLRSIVDLREETELGKACKFQILLDSTRKLTFTCTSSVQYSRWISAIKTARKGRGEREALGKTTTAAAEESAATCDQQQPAQHPPAHTLTSTTERTSSFSTSTNFVHVPEDDHPTEQSLMYNGNESFLQQPLQQFNTSTSLNYYPSQLFVTADHFSVMESSIMNNNNNNNNNTHDINDTMTSELIVNQSVLTLDQDHIVVPDQDYCNESGLADQVSMSASIVSSAAANNSASLAAVSPSSIPSELETTQQDHHHQQQEQIHPSASRLAFEEDHLSQHTVVRLKPSSTASSSSANTSTASSISSDDNNRNSVSIQSSSALSFNSNNNSSITSIASNHRNLKAFPQQQQQQQQQQQPVVLRNSLRANTSRSFLSDLSPILEAPTPVSDSPPSSSLSNVKRADLFFQRFEKTVATTTTTTMNGEEDGGDDTKVMILPPKRGTTSQIRAFSVLN